MRDVVGHLVGTNLVFVTMFERGPMPERGTDHLGTDAASARFSPLPAHLS